MTDTPSIDSHLERWNDVFLSRSWGRYPPEELIRFVARHFPETADRSQIRFLDIGCGPGTNLWFLVREGFTAAGIDGSGAALEQGRERLLAEGLIDDPDKVDLRQGNFAVLPWEDQSFDAVIDIEAIYANTMDTIHSCVAEIHRVLKANGMFFGKMFGTGTTGHDTGQILEANTSLEPTEGIGAGFGMFHFFTEDELKNLFRQFSFLGLDWVHRTDDQRTTEIFEWLVTARK